MNRTEQEAMLTISLMAALADGGKSELERAEIQRIAANLASSELNTAKLHEDVMAQRVSLATAASSLTTPDARKLAYETAVGVCEADDTLSDAEKNFLADLRRFLALDATAATNIEQQADAITLAPLPPALASTHAPPIIEVAPQSDAEIDQLIQNSAILNAALELLPDSLATMAIVPLQLRMVYRIGKRYGHTLDRRHITELIAAAGVGLTSQAVEGYARKLLGGILGKVGGGLGRMAGHQTASSALTFATTWALGKMAQRYYAGGRTLSALQLRELYSSLVTEAKSLHGRFAGDIQTKARGVNPAQLVNLVRGQ